MIMQLDALRMQLDTLPDIQVALRHSTTSSEFSSRVPLLPTPDLGHNLFYNLKVLVASLLLYF